MTTPRVWGPGPNDLPPVARARFCVADRAALGAVVSAAQEHTGGRLQVLRADRVLGPMHVLMAHDHALRARSGGRARADDARLEFLLYVAARRQIHRALADVGLPFGDPVMALVVDVGPVSVDTGSDRAARLVAALDVPGVEDPRPWPPRGASDPAGGAMAAWRQVGTDDEGPEADLEVDAVAAARYWRDRLAVPEGDKRLLEDAVLSAMARLALARV